MASEGCEVKASNVLHGLGCPASFGPSYFLSLIFLCWLSPHSCLFSSQTCHRTFCCLVFAPIAPNFYNIFSTHLFTALSLSFETRWHCIAPAGSELTMQTNLASSQSAACICFQSMGITSVCYHLWFLFSPLNQLALH